MEHERIIILDFGGQYAHLIASRIRRLGVLAEIMMPDDPEIPAKISRPEVKGLILSGGPQSVFAEDSPKTDPAIFSAEKPILGICYGHQYLAHNLGGKVAPGTTGEFGASKLKISPSAKASSFVETTEDKSDDRRGCPLFKDVPAESIVWMNHVDAVQDFAPGFENIGETPHCATAAAWNPAKNFYSVQFHLEVSHTKFGNRILKNFLEICGCSFDWNMQKFLDEQKQKLREKIGDKNVFLFVSGGVDSTVTFAFLNEIIGPERVKGLFVDTGLLRENEVEQVEKSLRAIGADLTTLREAETFLQNLAGKTDPEEKRKIIGHTFLDVQQDFFSREKLDEKWLLAQGTIYPDTIETGGTKNADKIKTHHNRAPEVQKLIDQGLVIEPIAELYKDEVRVLGELLGLPHELVWRHPFPGPGLGVRILCSDTESREILYDEVDAFTLQTKKKPYIKLPIKSVGVQGDFRTYKHPGILQTNETDIEELEKLATKLINHYSEINRCIVPLGKNFAGKIREISLHKTDINPDRVKILQRADAIVTKLLREAGEYETVWQFPVVLMPVSFNGEGTESIILRPVDSIDAMSASVGKLPFELLKKMAQEILKSRCAPQGGGEISAVFLDCTSKPPGTIEWE